jgi:uncharacterized OB-fold protein
MKKQVPFMEGIFLNKNNQIYLLGAKCKECSQIFFPKRESCINCFSEDCEEVTLGRKGKLYSFTISYMPVYHFNPPHAMGYIELPEGIRIFAPIKDWEGKKMEVGMEMELIIDKLWEDNESEITGYKFRPI